MNALGSLETLQAILWSSNRDLRSINAIVPHRDSTKTSRQAKGALP